MSIQAVSYVLQHSKTKLWDRLVLISLANHANPWRRTWPSVRLLAKEAGLSRRTVQRALNRLEKMGEIEEVDPKIEGSPGTVVWHMLRYEQVEPDVGEATEKSPIRSPSDSRRFPIRGSSKTTRNRAKGRQPDTPPGANRDAPTGGNWHKRASARHPGGVPVAPPAGEGGHGGGAEVDARTVKNHQEHARAFQDAGARIHQDTPAVALRRTAGASKSQKHAPAEPPAREPEPPPTPEDRANMKSILEHMRLVADGKAIPELVGPDYTP